MRKLPDILQRRIIAKTKFFTVQEIDLRFNNGTTCTYEKLASHVQGKSNAVMIVAINNDNEAILIEEYCGGAENYQLTLPKGLIEQGEDIFTAANRELQEEAGFKAQNLEYLTSLSLSPGYMEQFIHVVLAQNLTVSKLPGDEPEPLIVTSCKLDNLISLVQNPKFTEGRALAALFIAREVMQQRDQQSNKY